MHCTNFDMQYKNPDSQGMHLAARIFSERMSKS